MILRIVYIVVIIVFLIPLSIHFWSQMIGFTNLGFFTTLLFNVPSGEPQTELKLIGCGMPRTGSISTKVAIERTGLYRSYHGYDNWINGHSKRWIAALDDDEALDDLIKDILFMGFNGTSMDWPQAHFCVDFIKRFPTAKVILNVRDTPEVWFNSFTRIITHLGIYRNDTFPLWMFKGTGMVEMGLNILERSGIKVVDPKYQKSIFPWVDGNFVDTEFRNIDKESSIKSYENFIERVKRVTKKENLLIFNVKQGWDPLVEFLELDSSEVPTGKIPHVNQRFLWNIQFWYIWILIRTYPVVVVWNAHIVWKMFSFLLLKFSSRFSRVSGNRKKEN